METMTTESRTFEQKKTMLRQKLELAEELKLHAQVALIKREMKVAELEQKNTYPEVTTSDARNAMCPKTEIKFERKMTGKWWKKDWAECQHGKSGFSSIFGRTVCDRTDTHSHFKQKQLSTEVVGKEEGKSLYEITPLPMAALLRMKEAKDKNIFDAFQVWRPETNAEEKTRLEDPWLVGAIGDRYYKLCDWR